MSNVISIDRELPVIIMWSFLLGGLICIAVDSVGAQKQCRNCFNICLDNDQCDDYGCKPGYYGTNCTLPCPDNCRDGVSGRPVCSQDSGACLSGCQPGFCGRRCNVTCSSNCIGKICCQEDGVCTQGCRSHWYGPQCNKVCNKNCLNLDCERNGICNDCVDGWWGRFCENACSTKCVDNRCKMLEDENPKCALGCRTGWQGSYCDIPRKDCLKCSGAHKYPNYNNIHRIRRDTSDCYSWSAQGICECCKTGTRSTNCTEMCHRCKTKYNKPTCDYYCDSGFWGDFCQFSCSNCKSNMTCNSSTGECNGCIDGYHGTTCQYKCSKKCLDSKCSQMTGYCLKCPGTYSGSYCEVDCSSCNNKICDRWNSSCTEGCERGNYGSNCTFNCSKSCKNSECILTILGNPVCTGECVDTYRGLYCEVKCPVNCMRCPKLPDSEVSCHNNVNFDVKWIIIGVLIIIILLLLLFLIMCWKCRSKLEKRCPSLKGLQSTDTDDSSSISLQHAIITGVQCERQAHETADVDKEETQNLLNSGNQENEVAGSNMPRVVKPADTHSELDRSNHSLGLEEHQLIYLSGRLEEYIQREEGPSLMKELFTQLGYTEEKTHNRLSKDAYFMLKDAPNLHLLDTKQALVKLIVALRTTNMRHLAKDVITKYECENYLPTEFVDEQRRHTIGENIENKTVSYGNPEQQQEQNGGTISEPEQLNENENLLFTKM